MSTAKRTISLPEDQANFIDAKVASGDYASVSEVIRAGLSALRARDEAIERWLNGPVAAVYDAMKTDPDCAVSVDDAFAAVRARHQKRLQGA